MLRISEKALIRKHFAFVFFFAFSFELYAFHFSCSTVAFHNKEKDKSITLFEALKTLKAAGCERIDLTAYCDLPGICHDTPKEELKNLKKFVSANSIIFNSLHFGFIPLNSKDAGIKQILKAAAQAETLNIKLLVAPVSLEIETGKILDKTSGFKTLIKVLEVIKPVLIRKGLSLGLENHSEDKWLLRKGRDYMKIFSFLDGKTIGAVPDSGHFDAANDYTTGAFSYLLPKTLLVHLKDFKGGKFVASGKGNVNFGELFQLLKKHPYKYFISAEIEINDFNGDITEEIKRTLLYYRKM